MAWTRSMSPGRGPNVSRCSACSTGACSASAGGGGVFLPGAPAGFVAKTEGHASRKPNKAESSFRISTPTPTAIYRYSNPVWPWLLQKIRPGPEGHLSGRNTFAGPEGAALPPGLEVALPAPRSYFRYLSGTGTPFSSPSQYTVKVHQRVPSFISWKLLMPRVKGFSSLAWRDSYVLQTCAMWSQVSMRLAIEFSKKPFLEK